MNTIKTGNVKRHLSILMTGVLTFTSVFTSFALNVPLAEAAVTNFPVGVRPWRIAITPDGAHAYVTSLADNTVSVIQTSDNTEIDTVTVGATTKEIAITPDGARAYVTLDNNTVDVIRTSDNTVIDTVSVGGPGGSARGIAISPDGERVYVGTSNSAGKVDVIQTSDNTVIDTISVGAGPLSLTVTPDSSRVYVANAFANTVSVIRTSDDTVINTIAVGTSPRRIATSPDGARIYVANNSSGNVSVIRTSDNTVTDTVSVGPNAVDIAVTPDGAFAYVSTGNNQIVSIRTSDLAVTETIEPVHGPNDIAITPDGGRIYVANDNDNFIGTFITLGVTVETPNGGENFFSGDDAGIAFSTAGTIDHFKISLSTDSGATYPTVLTASTPSSPYSWTVNTLSTMTARIKVEAKDSGDTTIAQDESDADFTISLAGLIVNAPNGGDIFAVGDETNIDFGSAGSIDHFKISLSTDSGATFPTVLTASTPSSPYPWTVNNVTTTTARIRVEAKDSGDATIAQDDSDSDFEITPWRVIADAPNGGEGLTVGANTNITFSPTGTIDHFKVSLSTDSGATFPTVLTASTPSSPYSWTVNDLPTNTARIRIEAQDNANATLAQDDSDSDFSISPLPPGTPISVGPNPHNLVITPNSGRVYVANNGGDTVSVIQTSDNTVIDTITVGNSPTGIGITPNGARVYVANAGADTVSVIQTSDNTVIDTISLTGVANLAISPDGTRVYVASGDSIAVIATSSNTVIDTISLAETPYKIVVSPDGTKVYVSSAGSSSISVIQTSDDTIANTISLAAGVYGMTISPDGSRIYTANIFDNSVSIIQTSDDTVIDTFSAGSFPFDLAITPDGAHLYVYNLLDNAFTVYQTSDNALTETVGPISANSIAITPDGASVYVSDGNDPGIVTTFAAAGGGGGGGGGGFNNSTTFNRATMSRMKISTPSTVDIAFNLPDAITGTLTVTFPDEFTVTGEPTGGTCGSGTIDTFAFDAEAHTFTAEKHACSGAVTLIGGTVINPATPGSYTVSWVNDDPGSAVIFITSEDQIQVRARVGGAMSFNVGAQDTSAATCDETFSGNGGTVALGTITTTNIASSDVNGVNHICTRLSTNATHGSIVTVRSANAGLKSVSAPTDIIPSTTAVMAAGTANYGLCASDTVHGVGDTVPTGTAPIALAPFIASCPTDSATGSVGALTTTPQTVWAVTGGVTNAFYNLVIKAAISSTTPAHNDYADTLTFIATGTF
jgi:YVTN family beta-propeller protein